jgi:hypothetical protein
VGRHRSGRSCRLRQVARRPARAAECLGSHARGP